MFRFKYDKKGGKPDQDERACSGCYYMQGAISVWCVNREAADHRGTSYPNTKHCGFWEPMKPHGFWDMFDPNSIKVTLDGKDIDEDNEK